MSRNDCKKEQAMPCDMVAILKGHLLCQMTAVLPREQARGI